MADAAPTPSDDNWTPYVPKGAPAAPAAPSDDTWTPYDPNKPVEPGTPSNVSANPLSLLGLDKVLPKAWDEGPEGAATRAKVGAFASGLVNAVPFAKDAAAAAVPYAAKVAPAGAYPTNYTDASKAINENTAALTKAHPYYSTAGNVAGAVALSPFMPASGVGSSLLSGGVYGGLQGAGSEADLSPSERAERGLWGAGLGAIGGGTAGVLASPFRAAGPATVAAREAADQFGVDLPRAVAGSPASQVAGHIIGSTPLGGDISKATQTAVDQTGRAITKEASALGSGTKQGVIDQTIPTIRDWMEDGFDTQARQINRPVLAMRNAATAPPADLVNTRSVAQDIMNQASGAKGPEAGYTPAVQDVLDAATRPGGVNFNDVLNLRTALGKSAGWDTRGDQEGFKRLYGALTDDARAQAQQIGGNQGLVAFDRSNTQMEALFDQRKAVGKLLGTGPDESVVDRFASKAMDNVGGMGKGGDLATIAKVKTAIPESSYNDLVSSLVGHMAQAPDGSTSMKQFLTQWGNMSPAAKNQVFSTQAGQQVRGNLDQIAKVAQVLQNQKPGSHIAGQVAGVEQALGFVEHLFSGRFGQAARIAGTAAAAKLGGQYLASPVGSGMVASAMRAAGLHALQPSATTLTNLRNVAGRIGAVTGANVNDAMQGQ